MSEQRPESKLAIWNALTELSRHHRAFPDAPWVLPSRELERIEQIAIRFRPEDLVNTSRFLFDDVLPDIGVTRAGDFQAYQLALRDERIKAVRAIFESAGLPGLQSLRDTAKEALQIGLTLGEADVGVDEDAILGDLDQEAGARAAFAYGYARQRANLGRMGWIDGVLPRLDGRPIAQARLLGASLEWLEAWRRAEELGPAVAQRYWQEFMPYGLGHDFELVSETASKLLEYHRPGRAVDLLALYVAQAKEPIDPVLVAEALELLLESDEQEPPRNSGYELQQLLEYLRTTDINEQRLGALEWRLRPALGYGARSPILERRLATDPGFFVEVLSFCFRRRDKSTEDDVKPEVAQNAFHLLQDWRIVPGSSEPNGDINESQLIEWLHQARNLLEAADRPDIGDIYIGQIFAHSKEDTDGTWPSLPVRNAIETLRADKIDEGFRTEIYNERGVTSRGLTDGGKLEYELAERFERWSSLAKDKWPRTAAVLRSISEGYQAQGRAEDEEAKQFMEGLDR